MDSPRSFGKGDPRGIVAPESANNAVEAGDLIPTLLFGIPGGVPAAMLLGALLTYGIQPRPRIVTDHLDLLYVIIWCFAIANVVGAAICFLASPALAKLTYVRFVVLGPALVAVMLLGAFQGGGQIGDLFIMVALGVLGWVLKMTDYPRGPFLIGFVLALPLERYYYLTVNAYDGASWLTRPWVLVFLAVLALRWPAGCCAPRAAAAASRPRSRPASPPRRGRCAAPPGRSRPPPGFSPCSWPHGSSPAGSGRRHG